MSVEGYEWAFLLLFLRFRFPACSCDGLGIEWFLGGLRVTPFGIVQVGLLSAHIYGRLTLAGEAERHLLIGEGRIGSTVLTGMCDLMTAKKAGAP